MPSLNGLSLEHKNQGPNVQTSERKSYADHVALRLEQTNTAERDLFWQELQRHAKRLGITGA